MERASLVQQARAGDVEAFTMLVQRHQAMAFGYAYATLRDFSLAEDAAQLAFITAWRNLGTLRDVERFGSWLRTIVRYECLHLVRQRRWETTSLAQAEQVASTAPSPAETAEDHDATNRVMAALNALPESERLAMVLYSIHDHSQREVAAFLDLPVTTVNNRLRSARQRLRKEGLLSMTTDALAGHVPADEFSQAIGRIVRREGAVIDVRFPRTQRPPILNEVAISAHGAGEPVSAQVAQYLNDDLVRCVVLSDPNAGPDTADTVRDLAQPVSVPMEPGAIRQVIATIGRAAPNAARIETGIKVIDLFCPLGEGATVGIVGSMQSGKMVLVEELIHRLHQLATPVRLLVFVETTTEVAAIRQLEYRTSPTVEAVYLPVIDTTPEALSQAIDGLDAVITFDRELGKAGLYPAIDPLRSSSRWLAADVASEPHSECVEAARALLSASDHPDRRALLRAYLSQPFHVAKPFTGLEGEDVPLATTMADCTAILSGDRDDVSPDSLRMTGALSARAH